MTRYDGKTHRRRFKKLRIDEISVVDQPAQSEARVAIMKRAEVLEKNAKMALTSQTAGHAHSIVLVEAIGSSYGELRAGRTSGSGEGDDWHTHEWVMDDAGNIILADAHGHSHGISVLVTKEQAEAIAAAPADESHDAASNTPSDEDTQVTNTEKKAADEAVQKQLDELKKSNDRLQQVVSLSAEQRAHFDTLKGAEADEFLAAEDKDAVVKNAADADPVVYTTMSGRVLRKSAGEDTIAMAKELDAERKQRLASEAIAKRAELVKRAGEELGNLNGDESAKVELLNAVDGIPAEKRAPVLAMLKASDAGLAKAFTELGTTSEGDGTQKSAHEQVQEIAKKLQTEQPALTAEQAYVKALETPEGIELQSQLL